MAVLVKGKTFTGTEEVTSTKLHNLVDAAAFASGAVDDTTTALSGGSIIVKDAGVTTAKLANDAVTPAKLDEDNTSEFVMAKVAATSARLAVKTVTQSASTMSLDLADGNYQVITLDTSVETVDALANAEDGKQFTFVIDNRSTNTVTGWDSNWLWQGGTAPAVTPSGTDIISGMCVSIGGTVYALATMVKGFA